MAPNPLGAVVPVPALPKEKPEVGAALEVPKENDMILPLDVSPFL